jgi:sugar lactone lactonase YvrE
MRGSYRLGGIFLTLTILSSTVILDADEAPSGTFVTVAGTGNAGSSGDRGLATQATLNAPHGLAFDTAGNLYIADTLNNRVRRVDRMGIITGISLGSGPVADVAVDREGNLYAADVANLRVRKRSPNGVVTVVAGGGTRGPRDADGGPATEARLSLPTGLAVDWEGNPYIVDEQAGRIWKRRPDGIITVVAGGGSKRPNDADGGPATEARLSLYHVGLAVDSDSNLLIPDYGQYRVRKVSPDGVITTVAGNGNRGSSGDGGPATAAALSGPFDVTVDTAGNMFIADLGAHRVRKVSPDGTITTVAGVGKLRRFEATGVATETALRGPMHVAVNADGDLFISDSSALQNDAWGRMERVLKVVRVASPGLVAGLPFPQSQQP